MYKGSPLRLLQDHFPDYEFLPWLFGRTSRKYFLEASNRKKYIDWLMKKLELKSHTELETKHFNDHCGRGLLLLFEGSPRKVIDSLSSIESDNSDSIFKRSKKPHRFWVLVHYKTHLSSDSGF